MKTKRSGKHADSASADVRSAHLKTPRPAPLFAAETPDPANIPAPHSAERGDSAHGNGPTFAANDDSRRYPARQASVRPAPDPVQTALAPALR